MINFEDIKIVEKEESLSKIKNNDRYIIGCDPADQIEESNGSTTNVFTVYDKILGRVVTRCITNKSFDHFVQKMLTGESVLKMFKISKKFITDDGRAKRPADLRATA